MWVGTCSSSTYCMKKWGRVHLPFNIWHCMSVHKIKTEVRHCWANCKSCSFYCINPISVPSGTSNTVHYLRLPVDVWGLFWCNEQGSYGTQHCCRLIQEGAYHAVAANTIIAAEILVVSWHHLVAKDFILNPELKSNRGSLEPWKQSASLLDYNIVCSVLPQTFAPHNMSLMEKVSVGDLSVIQCDSNNL